MPTENNIDYTLLRVPDLKALCRERGLPGYTRMRKNELITCLNKSDVASQGHAIQTVPEVSERTTGVQTEREEQTNG